MAFVAPVFAALGSAAGAISTVVGLAGTALSVVGTMQAAQAQKRAANYNAAVAEQNARTANEQAAVKAADSARQTRQRIAAGRAGALNQGLELSGTVGDVLDQGQKQGELDYLTAVYDGEVRATGFRNNAVLYRMEASNASRAGAIGAATKAFSGLSSVLRV